MKVTDKLPKWVLDSIPDGKYCDGCPFNLFNRTYLYSQCSVTGRVVKKAFNVTRDPDCPNKPKGEA